MGNGVEYLFCGKTKNDVFLREEYMFVDLLPDVD